MTPDQITQLRQLIEKTRSVYAGYGSSERYEKLSSYLDQALALLPCPTCGDTKLVDLVGTGFHKHDNGIGDPPKLYPCPTCNGTGQINDERMNSDGVGFISKKDIPCPDCT